MFQVTFGALVSSLGEMKILVVDDEVAIRRMVESLLREGGHDVKAAADGSEAISLLSAERFDVLLSDIRMPGMNGHELAAWTAAHYPDTRTILMTWYDEIAPEYTLIPKPFLVRDLLEAMDEELKGPRVKRKGATEEGR